MVRTLTLCLDTATSGSNSRIEHAGGGRDGKLSTTERRVGKVLDIEYQMIEVQLSSNVILSYGIIIRR